MAEKEEISLLPQEEGNLERISNWVMETGRWIVVFTLFFVLLAFLSRFWLDQRIADLYAQTAQKIAIIESTKDFEADFRSLQTQIKTIKTLDSQKPNQTEKMAKIVAVLPENINLSALDITGDEVVFTVLSRNQADLESLFQNLVLCPYLDQINIANVSSKNFGLETELTIKAKMIEKNL